MGFFKKLFSKIKKMESKEWDLAEQQDWNVEDVGALFDAQVDFSDLSQREKYIKSLVERMCDSANQLDLLAREYNGVTGYLTDMEEIESLPEEERNELEDCAKRITYLSNEQAIFQGKSNRLTEEEFRTIERMESEIEGGIAKLKEAEQYQEFIRNDLKKLEARKHGYDFHRKELISFLINVKGMLSICFITFAACISMLLFLQLLFHMNTKLGYLFVVAAGAVSVTIIYVKYTEAIRDLRKTESGLNKLILLQNRVKIRYVNNTNLLEYLCLKYGVNESNQLEYLWSQYMEELEERLQFEQTVVELEFYEKELLRILRRYHLKYPNVWLRQTEAILEHKEMVEIRHGLILRRQKLRKQMEYNEELATEAKENIKKAMEQYPQYSKSILEIVTKYEKK